MIALRNEGEKLFFKGRKRNICVKVGKHTYYMDLNKEWTKVMSGKTEAGDYMWIPDLNGFYASKMTGCNISSFICVIRKTPKWMLK